MICCGLPDLAYFQAKEDLEKVDQEHLNSHIETLSRVDLEDLKKGGLKHIMLTLFGDEQWNPKRMLYEIRRAIFLILRKDGA